MLPAAVPRIVVAGAASGVGKTSIACGVIHALRRACGRGATVQAFKAGPDYIDTAYLSEASGRPAGNLDTWMMGRSGAAAEHDRIAEGASISVIEGVMGYYDGTGPDGDHSTYHVARAVGAPVALVVDASRTAHSVAAVAAGFAGHRRGSNIAGVILNRVGSERHEMMCRMALGRAGIAVLGAVPRNPALAVKSGRLGLVQVRQAGGRGAISKIAGRIAGHLDAGALLKAARAGGAGRGGRARRAAVPRPAQKAAVRICVARDDAFSFYYHNSLENLRRAGASLRFFSPISGKRLPESDMLYIGGGLPEEHASALEANSAMRRSVREFARGGGIVYAEGGGVAYLSAGLEYKGRSHAMAGVLDCRIAMDGKLRLGYTLARTVKRGMVITRRGAAVRGHAFHHMEARSMGRRAAFAYDIDRGPSMREWRNRDGGGPTGRDGMVVGSVIASMMQAYISPAAARRIVKEATKVAKG